MMRWIFHFLSKLVQTRAKACFAFIEKVVRRHLELVILAGLLLAMAYVAETRSVLSLEFSQNLFEFTP